MHYFYLLKNNQSGKLYSGYTSDLKRRMQGHLSAKSGFTSKGGQWKLIYYEAYRAKTDAVDREGSVKNHGNVLALLKKRIANSLRGT